MNQKSLLPGLTLSIFIFCVGFILPLRTVSQNIVNVNNLTGTASATIPIYNVSVGDLSAPVALTYNASGIKVEDYDNSVGLGWRLIAGASVSREVRGFPDDVEYQSDPSYPVIKGWIRSGNGAPQSIQSLSFANNGTNSCANEIIDATTIANNLSYMYDTEPDQFHISAPGLSCSFVFDPVTHAIKTIPYKDYQITYTTDTYGRIKAFTVINESGIKYYFDRAYLIENFIETVNLGTTVQIDHTSMEAFRRDYMMYRNKTYLPGYPTGTPLKYYDDWTLSKMEDTRGSIISYTYENYNVANPTILNKYSYSPIEILKPNGSGLFEKKTLYGIQNNRVFYRVTSISISAPGTALSQSLADPIQQVVLFNWQTPILENEAKLEYIELPLEKKILYPLYTQKFAGTSGAWYGYGRYFLKGFRETIKNEICSNVENQFNFTYYGVDPAANTCYCVPVLSPSNTLDTLIDAQDYWGYYNGAITNTKLDPKIYVYPDNPSIKEQYRIYPIPNNNNYVLINSNANRDVNITHTLQGSLKRIIYPAGGYTELVYENNWYFDYDRNDNVLGGGIRIKTIKNNDGLPGSPDEVTEYSYNDPVNTNITTGRPISLPKFAMAFQNSNTYGGNLDSKVKNSTYLSTHDLNKEPKDILYGKVTVKKSGLGKSVYEYNTAGTFGSSPVTDWEESKNYVSRTNLSTPCTTSIAPSFLYNNSGYLQYPFTPNANFDFERGLPTKVTHYNQSNQVVAAEDYTYARSHTNQTKIYAVKLDDIGNTMVAYGKYAVNPIVDNFLVTKTSKLYNSNSANPVTDVETFVYTPPPGSSLNYRLLKEVRKQNSNDPGTNVTRFKYVKEYTAITGGDDMNRAIFAFNSTLHKNPVIETIQLRDESGQEKVTSGSFNTFKEFTLGHPNGNMVQAYLPYKSFHFVKQAGTTGFTPTYISGSSFTWDALYNANTPTTIEQYSLRGIPQLMSDNSRIPKTALSTPQVNTIKVAEFTNAKPENVGFSNFEESTFTANFGWGNNAQAEGGRYSTKCLNFQPNTTICRTLNKTVAKNLIVSFWLKDAQAAGNIFICYHKLGGACGTFSCMDASITVPFTYGSQWKFHQVMIPWTSGLTTLSFGLSTSAAVKIDDVLIYPDNSNVTTYSYTSNNRGTNFLTAKTGINGIGNTYEYDDKGRLWITRDQFENILEMKKYKITNRHLQQIPSVEIDYNRQGYTVNVPAAFGASPPFAWETGDCDAPSIVYNWDFGDGTTGVSRNIPGSRGGTTINHTYTKAEKYLVTVTASSPGMQDRTAYTPPITNVPPAQPPVTVNEGPAPCNPGGTPVVCASGIIQNTSTNQCILATCGSLPSTCSETYFTVSGVTDALAVQWERMIEGSNTWTVYQPEPPSGVGGFVTSVPFHIIHTTTYSMRARVRFCDNSTAYSNAILIKNRD